MKFFKIFLLFFGAIFLHAQYTVSGVVHDFHNHIPLSGTTLSLDGKTAVSDGKGFFKFENIPAGNHTLSASHPNCSTVSEKISVKGNLVTEINLEHHDFNEIEAVKFSGKKATVPGIQIVKNVENLDRHSGENLGNILGNISGVSVLKTGNNIAKPIIHGLYGTRIAILNNGVKLEDQEWGAEHAPNIEIDNSQKISVVKGASALRFGSGSMGGAVVLEPVSLPKKDSLFGNVSLTGFSNGRGLEAKYFLANTYKNGWAIKNGGNYKKSGDLSAPDYGLMNTGQENSSFSFGVQKLGFVNGFSADYYLTNQNIGILRSSHISSADDFAEALTSQEPLYQRDFSYKIGNPRQEIQHHILKLSAYHRFAKIGKVTATYSLQYNHRKEFDIRRTAELSAKPALDLELITNDFSIENLFEREKYTIETGIGGQYQNNYSNPETEARRLIPNYDKYSGFLYSVLKYKISPKFTAEAGIRGDFTRYDVQKWYDLSDWNSQYANDFKNFEVRVNKNRILTNPLLNFTNISANVGAEFKPTNNFSLRMNISQTSGTPNIAQLFSDGLHHSAAIIEKGDLRIKNENSTQINLVADAHLDFLKGLQLSVNPYFMYAKNFINQIPSGYQNTQWGDFVVWKYIQTDAKMYGIDADAILQITDNLKYKGNASYIYGQDEKNNVPLILMQPANFRNALELDFPKFHNFYLSAENKTVLQQKRFPVYDIAVQLFDNEGNAYEQPIDISTPPKGYSLWNFGTGMDFTKNFRAIFSVQNAFNIKYRDYLNRLRYFSDEMGRNFTLSLQYKF